MDQAKLARMQASVRIGTFFRKDTTQGPHMDSPKYFTSKRLANACVNRVSRPLLQLERPRHHFYRYQQNRHNEGLGTIQSNMGRTMAC
jgi:hypothetical protein